MARTTISLPDDLKAAMDKVSDQANWSEVAALAFRAEVERIRVRKLRTEGKKMNAAIERLKKSKQVYGNEARERGHADGVQWAQDTADYGELKRLAEQWASLDEQTTETTDAYGAPGVFQRMIAADDYMSRSMIDDFWTNLGKDQHDEDAYSVAYWDGFVEGAIEVFEQVDD